MDQEDQILVELSSLDDLLLPLSRSARLKYNCMSVSPKFIALGSNTGGVYLFSRENCNFIQVVFAEKETSPVLMAVLSSNDKYVAMVASSGILHVIDLKMESRAKPETLRFTSDWEGTLTYLHWDVTCSKLYYGDSMGGIYEMTVHSSKAKNLFTLPPEHILKLDSSIVQIDKAGDKLLVSTVTRCYLCDTSKQQFSTIGKKLRDGQFGACFISQGTSPTIYCARPGSRMWEVDTEGEVMNTHQFKQLLAIPPMPVVKIKESFQLPSRDTKCSSQSLNFPRLKVVSGSYILTWTERSLYVLDPVNIKVVLWSQSFTGILDVYCLNNNIFIFLASMQVHCLSLLPVSRVTALCFNSEAFINAANLCIYFENSFCLKRKKGNFDLNCMKALYDKLITTEFTDLAEKLHSVIINTERKLASLSDSESTGSNKSRTNSILEKDATEKIPNHKVEVLPVSNHIIVDDTKWQLDRQNLESFVNQTENLPMNQTSDIFMEEKDNLKAGSVKSKGTDSENQLNIENKSDVNGTETQSSVNGIENQSKENGIEDQLKENGIENQSHVETVAYGQVTVIGGSEQTDNDTTFGDVEPSISLTTLLTKPGEKDSEDKFSDPRAATTKQHVCNYGDQEPGKAFSHVSEYPDNTLIVVAETKEECEGLLNDNVDGVTSLLCSKEHHEHVIDTLNGEGEIKIDSLNAHLKSMEKPKSENTLEVVENFSVDGNDTVEPVVTGKHVSSPEVNSAGSDSQLIKEHEHFPLEILIKGEKSGVDEEDSVKMHLGSTLNPDIETAVRDDHLIVRSNSPASVRSKSPAPSTCSQKSTSSKKSGELDDILEDDLDSQYRSGHMGPRRQSLTSLSSLSSAEVTLEQFPSNTQEEIAVPVKRKSSKRKHRKSFEGSGEVKQKGVKINRSFSLGAVEAHSRKELISPLGSLDLTTEKDCFTAADSETVKRGQQTVSQSAPTGTEEHFRSLPSEREFENEALAVPVLDFRQVDEPIKESVLSLSAEFTRSDEFTKSGEYPESFLLRSFEGTREGMSSSPKTALKHLKDRVQKNLKSQTKKVITNIKDKHLLTRAKEFLSQPIDMIEHQRSEFSIQAQEYGAQSSSKPDTEITVETDSIPKCPVDISALKDITTETQNKLEDPSVLLNPDTVYKILLDWVTVLNKTFQQLHVMKFAQSALGHAAAVSNHASGGFEVAKSSGNLKSIEPLQFQLSLTEVANENASRYDTSNGFEIKSELDDTNKSKRRFPGAVILNDKDFCYTKDPLFLPASVFSDVSELAQACFDVGCCGNILKCKNLHSCENESRAEKGENVNEVKLEDTKNLPTEQVVGTKDEAQLCLIMQKPKNVELGYEAHALIDSLVKDVCDINIENSIRKNSSENTCSRDGENIADNSVQQNIASAVKVGDLVENGIIQFPVYEVSEVKGDGHNCEGGSDDELAFFVRCYFPYLSAMKIRNKTKELGKCWYKTWCALVSCLQELASEDSERFGLDRDSLLQHMIECLSPGDDGYSLLGHVSKLFATKSSNLVSACVQCQPYIQPIDVLYMCRLHEVAIETIFKPYMQQVIQNATRTHRKDTIPALYSHLEVKRAWLNILLAEEGNTQEMVDNNGNPFAMSHEHIWRNQPDIEAVMSQTEVDEDKNIVLELCSKYGYWKGCLRILKDFQETLKRIDLILHLDDVRLFSSSNPIGYLPKSSDEWKQLLLAYKAHNHKYAEAGSQSDVIPHSDWSDRITWNSLGNLLVRHLGPSQAVSLLQEMEVPESNLASSFYQTCAMAGLVQKHQRLVLHSMLEKIDTYLWAQRPVYSSPQLHYIVVKERELQSKGSNSSQQEHLQKLIQQMKSDQKELVDQYVEDPECHWGVETKINLVCPCCNIPLKETVSHVEPGVLLFKCGHGYHRMCLPDRNCFLCLETEDATYTAQKMLA